VWARAVVRESLMLVDPSVPRRNSALAGSVTGGLLTTIFAGPVKGLQGAVFWGAVGLLGQLAVDELEKSRARHLARVLERRKARLDTSREAADALQSEIDTIARVNDMDVANANSPPNSAFPSSSDFSTLSTYSSAAPSLRDLGRGPLSEFLPSWMPFSFLSEEEYEAKLRKRLRLIESALARDDAYRVMIDQQVRDYDAKQRS
jgi:hypothetical protein